MTGIRSWISATNSLESVVMMANVRIHSPDVGSCQFSHMPAMPNGAPMSTQPITLADRSVGLQHGVLLNRIAERTRQPEKALRLKHRRQAGDRAVSGRLH